MNVATGEIFRTLMRHPNDFFGRDAWLVEFSDYEDENLETTYIYIPRSEYSEFFYIGEV
jgi:hypothetical protein